MDKKIYEESPTPTPKVSAPSGAQDRIRKAARQLAYDTRYKVKSNFSKGQKTDPNSLKRAYLQQLNKSPAPGPVKALAKQMLLGEEYNSEVTEMVTESLSKVLSKVFVEGIEEVIDDSEYLNKLFENTSERTYKVRVTDTKNKTTYVRYANREKISELRSNGLKVEMTKYGEPYEGERKRGEKTAAALGGGSAKKDYDGDGKIESPAKEHAGAVHNAIQRKKGGVPNGKDTSSIKESVATEKSNKEKLDIRKTKNKVTLFPDSKVQEAMQVQTTQQPQDTQQQKKPNISAASQVLQAKAIADTAQRNLAMKQKMAAQQGVNLTSLSSSYEMQGDSIEEVAPPGMEGTVKAMKKHKEIDNPFALAWYMKNKGYKSHRTKTGSMKEDCGCEENPKMKDSEPDVREIPTKVNLIKNKLRAMGLKMSYEPDGKVIGE